MRAFLFHGKWFHTEVKNDFNYRQNLQSTSPTSSGNLNYSGFENINIDQSNTSKCTKTELFQRAKTKIKIPQVYFTSKEHVRVLLADIGNVQL